MPTLSARTLRQALTDARWDVVRPWLRADPRTTTHRVVEGDAQTLLELAVTKAIAQWFWLAPTACDDRPEGSGLPDDLGDPCYSVYPGGRLRDGVAHQPGVSNVGGVRGASGTQRGRWAALGRRDATPAEKWLNAWRPTLQGWLDDALKRLEASPDGARHAPKAPPLAIWVAHALEDEARARQWAVVSQANDQPWSSEQRWPCSPLIIDSTPTRANAWLAAFLMERTGFPDEARASAWQRPLKAALGDEAEAMAHALREARLAQARHQQLQARGTAGPGTGRARA